MSYQSYPSRWRVKRGNYGAGQTRFEYIIQVVMRSDDKKSVFKPTHKRWVVERTFAWLDNDRKLCRNYELLMESSQNMVKLSAIKLLLNKI
jgi:transposase